MKLYSISVLHGRETVERDIVILKAQVNSWVEAADLKDNFIIVDSYTKRDYRHRQSDEVYNVTLVQSILYLRGVEVFRKDTHINPLDIENVKKDLTAVFHMDGTVTYLPAFPLSGPDVQQILGTELSTMHCVKDEPQRWVTISVEPKPLCVKEKPELNKKASKLFGRELYGNVIYINENLVS